MKVPDSIRDSLESAFLRINTPEFIPHDPVQFPRRFSSLPDREIMALLASAIAWGRRPQILKDCEKLVTLMHGEPHAFLMSGDWEGLDPDCNVHRTCFVRHLQYLLRALRAVYSRHPSLEAFAIAEGVPEAEAPAWRLVDALSRVARDVNGGARCPEVIPSGLDTTALKRYNMALRWLVRDDGIVDLGAWKSIRPSQLFIPLDVHVAATSRSLGLLARKSNDRKAVEQLTASLRTFDPADPVKYDFALFGLGIERAAGAAAE